VARIRVELSKRDKKAMRRFELDPDNASHVTTFAQMAVLVEADRIRNVGNIEAMNRHRARKAINSTRKRKRR